MEPKPILFIVPPQDIIAQLIDRRVAQLDQRYPEFKE